MSAPLPVRPQTERAPRDRPQNVITRVLPPAREDFAYYRMSQVAGERAAFLSVWGYPWWYADEASAPTTGAFTTEFSSAFDGGLDSPQASSFSPAFSAAFH